MNRACAILASVLLLASSAGAATVSPNAAQAERLTFSKQIAPLLFEHCVVCHRPGGSAPFSLLTYLDVKPHARQIVRAITTGAMPPWKPQADFGDFVGSRRLSSEEVAVLTRWVQEGGTEGDPHELPEPPHIVDGWQLGQPDLVVRQERPYRLGATGADRIRNFVLPVPSTIRRYVRAWEFRTDTPQVIHHATVVLDPTRASRELDERDPEPGYEGLIPLSAQNPDGYFLGWTPGQSASAAPASMAWPLEPGSDLVLMLHLRPDGQPQDVDVSIGLYFSDAPPTTVPAMIRLNRQDIDIPAGDARYVIRDSYTLPIDVYAYNIQPHAHGLAREIKSIAMLPDGSQQRLLYIRDWDFHWQDVYRYRKPVWLPAGSRLEMEITYDNSSANRANPSFPPRRVLYGQQSTNEMGDVWLQVVPARAEDLHALTSSIQRKLLPQNIDGYRTMLRGDPLNAGLHSDLALLYVQAGDVPAAASEFRESLRLSPDSPAAYYNVANCELMLHRPATAEILFRQALLRRSDYGLAQQGLALALQAQGRLQEAATQFASAIELLPTAEAHYNFGALRHRQGQLDAALAEYGQALRIAPDYADAHFGRGLVLAAVHRDGEAIESFRRALATRPEWSAAQLELAWVLATSEDQSARNPTEALRLVQQLLPEKVGSKARLLDVTAAAQAASGRFASAIETALMALAALTSDERPVLGPEIERRLDDYRSGRPFKAY